MRTDVGVRSAQQRQLRQQEEAQASTCRSQIIVDTMMLSDEGLRHLVNEFGVSQIVYGTDNPLNWPVTVDLVLNASWLSNADKEAILGGNLIKLLRITSS